MELFPAIDIRNGRVVRLTKGDYAQMRVYGDEPAAAAEAFCAQGARNLHVVDLDGAKDGTNANFPSVKRICEKKGLFVQVGGGIRDEKRIAGYLELGVRRVILGTAAVKDFPFLEEMVKKYGDRIAVGADARDGFVAVSGWLETTKLPALAFCKKLRGAGVRTVIYTDIARDGMLAGCNLEAYRAVRREAPGLDVIASGGVSSAGELKALREMGVYGAIVGKALYEGTLSLANALAAAQGKEENA